MRLRAFGATIAGLSGPKGGVARPQVIGIAAQCGYPPTREGSVGSSKGNPNGQAEGTTRHHSRVDGTCARETTIRPAGTSFCKIRGPTTQPATRPPSAARRDHGMAAATHGTTLICKMLPGRCECVFGPLLIDIAALANDRSAPESLISPLRRVFGMLRHRVNASNAGQAPGGRQYASSSTSLRRATESSEPHVITVLAQRWSGLFSHSAANAVVQLKS
jgi:hypothetical protein